MSDFNTLWENFKEDIKINSTPKNQKTMETEYNVDYFIKKFEAIPEEKWTILVLIDNAGRSCALGHCGVLPTNSGPYYNTEGYSLRDLLEKHDVYVMAVNDGNDKNYQQPTPKQRILAALYDIKAMQEKQNPVTEKPAYKVVRVHEKITEYDLVSCSN